MSRGIKTGPGGERLVGIRGWLIFPAIGLVFTPFLGIICLFFSLGTPNKMLEYGYGLYGVSWYAVNIGLWFYTCIAAVEFFKKQSNAPRTAVRLLTSCVISSFALFLLGMVVVGGFRDRLLSVMLLMQNNFVGYGLSAAVWVPYFKFSRRVKATFVN